MWGLLKKIVIADSCAELANQIFNNSSEYSGSTLIIGAIFFAFQIYGDFSGYSDIAIGSARLFGFDLMQNFAFPYFSRDIAEFWRRWHISLSTWFRDYLYIPLGGSRGSVWMKVRNVFVIFIVSGLWHGANWTFVAWGALNAIYFLPVLLMHKNRNNVDCVIAQGRFFPSFKEFCSMIITFGLVTIAWIFFRAENMGQALRIVSEIFSRTLFSIPDFERKTGKALMAIVLILSFLLVEWLGREQRYAIEKLGGAFPSLVKWVMFLMIVMVIYFFGNFSESIEFIYFQF